MKPITATQSRFSSALVLAAILLSGCAAMSDNECRSADWYVLGERDALIHGLRPQIDLYAQQCSRYGVQPAEKDYLTGWFYGYHEHALRLGGEHP
jgi:hypothetical protein